MILILIVVGIVLGLLYIFNSWVSVSPNTKNIVNIVSFALLIIWIILHLMGKI